MEKNNDKIFFRAFTKDDYLLINKWRTDESVQKMTVGPFRYVSLEMEKEWVYGKMMNNTKDIYLAICLKSYPDKMIGYTSLNNIDYINRSASVGGVVIGDLDYRDGDIRHEVGVKTRKYAFDELNLHRLKGTCLSEHKVSSIMMEASGFKLEGVERQAVYKHGVYHDILIYSLLEQEYRELVQAGAYELYNYARRVKRIWQKYKENKDE